MLFLSLVSEWMQNKVNLSCQVMALNNDQNVFVFCRICGFFFLLLAKNVFVEVNPSETWACENKTDRQVDWKYILHRYKCHWDRGTRGKRIFHTDKRNSPKLQDVGFMFSTASWHIHLDVFGRQEISMSQVSRPPFWWRDNKINSEWKNLFVHTPAVSGGPACLVADALKACVEQPAGLLLTSAEEYPDEYCSKSISSSLWERAGQVVSTYLRRMQ